MDFQIRQCTISVEFGFFMLAALFLVLDKGGMGLLVLGAGMLHEMGHIMALVLSGGRIRRLELRFCGVGLVPEGILSYQQEGILFGGGICANMLGCLAGLCLDGVWHSFGLANGAMCVFHMLPVGFLDGGRLLYWLFERGGAVRAGVCAVRAASLAILLPLVVLGVLLFAQRNPTLLITSVYLLIMLLRE